MRPPLVEPAEPGVGVRAAGAAQRFRVLALGTSTDWCSVALLVRDGANETCTDAAERAGNDHSRRVLPMALGLLRQAGLALSDIDVLAFDAGPGSFTGLRIGCAVAQGLAFALDIPVVPVPSLQALALQSGAPFSLAVLDARMHEVYAAPYRTRDGWPELLEPIQAMAAEQAADVLLGWSRMYGSAGADALPVDVSALGDAFTRHPLLATALVAQGLSVDALAWPGAHAIARIAAHRYLLGQALDAADAAPLYVRDKVALDVDEQRRARAARTGVAGMP